MTKSNITVGPVFKKAMYVEYTDATFTKRAQVPAYLGILGPMLKVRATRWVLPWSVPDTPPASPPACSPLPNIAPPSIGHPLLSAAHR